MTTAQRLKRIEDVLTDLALLATNAKHLRSFERLQATGEAQQRLAQYLTQIREERS